MRLGKPGYLTRVWEHALNQEANLVLMRHAPKSGGDQSGLSAEGEILAVKYGKILRSRFPDLKNAALACTSKERTQNTLKLMFPKSNPEKYLKPADLEVNKVSPHVQNQVDELNKKIGCWLGYTSQMTYCFLEELGGHFDEENLHTVVVPRMIKGINALLEKGSLVIYCGHSPAIELVMAEILQKSIAEIGGFLNPLDSFHLQNRGGKIELVARVNPIINYMDARARRFLK